MAFLKILAYIFFLPGNLLLSSLKVSISEDSGMLRSMINMLFWGTVGVFISLPFIF